MSVRPNRPAPPGERAYDPEIPENYGSLPEERRRSDGRRVCRDAGPDHRGVHRRHHDPGLERQQHVRQRVPEHVGQLTNGWAGPRATSARLPPPMARPPDAIRGANHQPRVGRGATTPSRPQVRFGSMTTPTATAEIGRASCRERGYIAEA